MNNDLNHTVDLNAFQDCKDFLDINEKREGEKAFPLSLHKENLLLGHGYAGDHVGR